MAASVQFSRPPTRRSCWPLTEERGLVPPDREAALASTGGSARVHRPSAREPGEPLATGVEGSRPQAEQGTGAGKHPTEAKGWAARGLRRPRAPGARGASLSSLAGVGSYAWPSANEGRDSLSDWHTPVSLRSRTAGHGGDVCRRLSFGRAPGVEDQPGRHGTVQSMFGRWTSPGDHAATVVPVQVTDHARRPTEPPDGPELNGV